MSVEDGFYVVLGLGVLAYLGWLFREWYTKGGRE